MSQTLLTDFSKLTVSRPRYTKIAITWCSVSIPLQPKGRPTNCAVGLTTVFLEATNNVLKFVQTIQELTSKILPMKAVITRPLSLNCPTKTPGKPLREQLASIYRAINRSSPEIIQQNLKTSNSVDFIVPGSIQLDTPKYTVLFAFKSTGHPWNCLRICKQVLGISCAVLFQFIGPTVAMQFLQSHVMVFSSTSFKVVKITPEKTRDWEGDL